MENLNILTDSVGYLTIIYKDKSMRVIRTTFNNDILASLNLSARQDAVYDFDREVWISLPSQSDECTFNITEDRPRLEGVNEFANRF